jgi:RimJ/RimL family protein N-acetyltransferase
MRIEPVTHGTPDGRSCVIRSARPDDAGRVLDHAMLIHEHDPGANVPDSDELHLSADRLRSTLQAMSGSENSLFLVADARKSVIATLTVEGGRYRKVRHTGRLGISVHPRWRRQGVGRALMEAAIAASRSGGSLTRLTLRVFSSNGPAMRLYESLGFAKEGRLQRQVRIGDGYADEILMARDLVPD